ncbi:unnamed protein product, partial [Discosporangium mesarthrocarpum]
RCLEVEFPTGFMSERVGLDPELRVFQGVRCPDVDFVGQGLVREADGGGTWGVEEGLVDRQGRDQGSRERLERGGDQVAGVGMEGTAGMVACGLTHDLFEWLGAVSCGLGAALEHSLPLEPYVSAFKTPRHLRFQP